MPARRLVDINAVRSHLGNVSAGLVKSLVRAGDLPAPYRLGQLCRWDLDEVDAALERTRVPKKGA
ncbi:helix-turn-helix transcriptional regulator [Cupriavidus pinatubonensis]|uniref:helix-turn-helix transcriptional regulator n=1 Tax=Cupriavidus pinatubonensis TaxID=248026 RepID=UPI00112A984D|nr:hypothetical protein [Cupriavidus pinatubonensis]